MSLTSLKTLSVILLASFSSFGNDFEKGNEYYKKGIEFDISNDFDNALINYLKANYYLSQTDSVRLLINVKNDIGVLFEGLGNQDAALKYYNEALELAYNKSFRVLLSYNKSGALMKLGKYDEALRLLTFCYSNNDENNYRKANIINRTGLILLNIGDHKEAANYFHRLINGSRLLGSDSSKYLGKGYHNLGYLYFTKGDFVKAKEFYSKSIKHRNSGLLYALSLQDLGETLYNLGQYDSAIATLIKAKGIVDQNKGDLTFNQIQIDKFLYKAYDSIGDYQKSSAHRLAFESNIDDYYSKVDSLNLEDTKLRSQMIYEQFVNELDEKDQLNTWYWIIGVSSLLAILIVLIIVRTEKNKRKKTLLEISRIVNSA